jgi:hypothetical protein
MGLTPQPPRPQVVRKPVRVVLASPNDVAKERKIFRGIVDGINSELAALQLPVSIELYTHEVDSRPGLDPGGPQALVEDRLDIPRADLVIGIFWRRFGTPTQTGQTGTEREIRLACECKLAHGRPEVMVYFRDPGRSPKSKDGVDQFGRVLAFKQELQTQVGVKTEDYSSLADFVGKLGHHLHMFINDRDFRSRVAPPILACSAHAVPRTLRDDGLTELVGDVVLTCTSLEPTGVDALFDIRLYILWAPVTNRIIQGFETDAVITDHGGRAVHGVVMGNSSIPGDPPNQRNCLLFQGVRISLQNSAIQADGRSGYTATGQKTILIRNVRVISPAMSPTSVPTQVYYHVDVRTSYSSSPIVVVDSVFPAGTVEHAIEFHMYAPNGERDQPVSFPRSFGPAEHAQSLGFAVSFKERFPGAFKSLAEEVGYGSDVGVGFAHHGTRLLVRFVGIPPRFQVSVTTRDIVPEGAPEEVAAQAVLVCPESEAQQAGHGGPAKLAQLSQTEGCAVAQWEVVGLSTSAEPREIRFGVKLDASSLDIYAPEALRTLRPMCINGCLAPLSTVDYASRAARVKHFETPGMGIY